MVRVAQAAFDILGKWVFLTTGEDESRAWIFRRGAKAPECAGVIHSDLQRGFIKADVIRWDELLELGSLAAARCEGQGAPRRQGLRGPGRRRARDPLQRLSRDRERCRASGPLEARPRILGDPGRDSLRHDGVALAVAATGLHPPSRPPAGGSRRARHSNGPWRPSTPPGSVLDVGAGAGAACLPLAPRATSITAVDTDHQLLGTLVRTVPRGSVRRSSVSSAGAGRT